MKLFLEFHILQNFAPSNLNRDDTGAPKDALFGGHRRARISSQCLKRAVRLHAQEQGILPIGNMGIRTKKLRAMLETRLAELGHTESTSHIEMALAGAGLKLTDDGLTQYLLFLGRGEIEAFAQLIHAQWDSFETAAAGTEKKSKKDAKAGAPPEVVKQAKAILDGQKAVDVALFGRMLADLPAANQHAASQVAHAISTHRVEREFDYFTAVDDAGSADETGAGMIGQVEFNSATFYRYAVLDVAKLVDNLGGDGDLALAGIRAFTDALVRAIPTGKQNTFAAHNPPSFVGVVARHTSPFNLANAFEKPVWAKLDSELTTQSVARLAGEEARVAGAYGDGKDEWAILDLSGAWPQDQGTSHKHLASLTDWAVATARTAIGG
jgi:CRISPR system Cascade subunit CasC